MSAPPTGAPAAGGRRRAVVVLQLFVAALLVCWLLATGRLDLVAYARLLDATTLPLLVGLVAFQLAVFGVFIARWRGLAAALSLRLGWREVLGTGMRGLFSQLFVPGGLGVDAIRLLHVRMHHRPHLAAGVASLLADRLAGIVGLLLVGTVAGLIHRAEAGASALDALVFLHAGSLCVLGVAGCAGLWLLRRTTWRLRWLGDTMSLRVSEYQALLTEVVGRYAAQPVAFVRAVALSAVGHVMAGMLSALGIVLLAGELPSLAGVVAVAAGINLLLMLPFTPLGIGVADAASESLLALLGSSMGAELQMLLRLVSVAIYLVSGLAFLAPTLRPSGREGGRAGDDDARAHRSHLHAV